MKKLFVSILLLLFIMGCATPCPKEKYFIPVPTPFGVMHLGIPKGGFDDPKLQKWTEEEHRRLHEMRPQYQPRDPGEGFKQVL